MDNDNSVIYGLEFQARALAAQIAETEKIRFILGTQSLKQFNNQHSSGEIWKLTASPLDSQKIATCYNTFNQENMCCMKTAILRLQGEGNPNEVESLETVTKFRSEEYGQEIKTSEFHPSDGSKMLTVLENRMVLWDTSDSDARPITTFMLEGKNNPKFTTGKWNPHQNCNQFSACVETGVRTWDVRSAGVAWQVDGAHGQLVRDLDYNLNKQYHVATCGDDGYLRIWDFRHATQPVYARSDHSHWVWCVRFNPFHDQLLLTASSDGQVIVSSASSVSSDAVVEEEGEARQIIPDGPLQRCEHEDSVYCVEWSPAEPWTFASLSYDGRLLVSRVRRSYKYQILL